MKDLYKKLTQMQINTKNSTFIMGFSTKRHLHYIKFTTKVKVFQNQDVVKMLEEAIEWMDKTRIQENDLTYTLPMTKY